MRLIAVSHKEPEHVVALHVLAALGVGRRHILCPYVLRYSVGTLEPAVLLVLGNRVFGRFFPWVSTSVMMLLS